MAVEIKDKAESAVENGVMGADFVTGAAVTIAETVTQAVAHPVRTTRKLERRGAPLNKQISRDVRDTAQESVERIEAVMPEKVALMGLRMVKDRARRKDLVGDVAYRTLEFINGGLESVLGTLNRFERATEPPARPGDRRPTPSSVKRSVRKTVRTVSRATKTTTRKAGATARRGAARARATEKKATSR
ncbi:MAG: hypothetical protein NVS9B1_04110 [Candidatus Dormibacteraceae bacterium]